MAPATVRRRAALCGAFLLAGLRVAESGRHISGMELGGSELAPLEAAAHPAPPFPLLLAAHAAPAVPLCKRDLFQAWWQDGEVPASAASGTACESPCLSDCARLLQHRDLRIFQALQSHFQISDVGQGSSCTWCRRARRQCLVAVARPAELSKELAALRKQGATSPVDVLQGKVAAILGWSLHVSLSKEEPPRCSCSFCSAAIMPFILSEAGQIPFVDSGGKDHQCVGKRGAVHACSQFLREQDCSCSKCFGGAHEARTRLNGPKQWFYNLDSKKYEIDVAQAMSDIMAGNFKEGACGGRCAYKLKDWKGQK